MNAASPSLPFVAVSKLAGVLLLTAGLLKTVLPAHDTPLGLSGPLLLGVAGVEILLGLWLLLGWYPVQTRWVALAAFSGLLGVALFTAFRGDSSCNCFGTFSVNPWWMVLLDGSIAGALLTVPVDGTPRFASWRPVLGCSLALLAAGAGAYSGQVVLTGATAGRDAVIITRSNWEESAQRIFEDADIGEELRHGEWVVLLHRHNCPQCTEAIDLCRRAPTELGSNANRKRFALVEITETGVSGSTKPTTEQTILVGRLRQGRRWVVSTPLFLHTYDGQVYRVCRGLNAEAGETLP